MAHDILETDTLIRQVTQVAMGLEVIKRKKMQKRKRKRTLVQLV
jgi:hypothetical protein